MSGHASYCPIIVCLGVCAAARGEPTVRLLDVPGQTQQATGDGPPLGKEPNRIPTAVVEGGEIASVFLAANVGDAARVPLTKTGQYQFQINLDSRDVVETLRRTGPNGEFRIFAETQDGTRVQSVAVRLLSPPAITRLQVPEQGLSVRAYQCSNAEFPDNPVRVALGDITGGHASAALLGHDQDVIVGFRNMHAGDFAFFVVSNEEFVLVADQLVNLLVGEDYAYFSLWRRRAWDGEKINRLLDLIEASNLVFIRNDEEHSGKEAAAHLRKKLAHAKEKGESLPFDRFVDDVASKSWLTGKPYRIRLPSGETLDAATWMRQQPLAKAHERLSNRASPPRSLSGHPNYAVFVGELFDASFEELTLSLIGPFVVNLMIS